MTVVLSEDREAIDRECGYPMSVGPIYGCQTSHRVALHGALHQGRPLHTDVRHEQGLAVLVDAERLDVLMISS